MLDSFFFLCYIVCMYDLALYVANSGDVVLQDLFLTHLLKLRFCSSIFVKSRINAIYGFYLALLKD